MADQDVVMLLSGDLYIQRPEPESIFEYTAKQLREADIFFGNLEAAVTDRGKPTEAKPIAQFKSEERMFPAYLHAGLDACGLANNHSMNYGPEGLLRTIDLLDGAGIVHAGGGKDYEEAHKPGVLERKGNKVAFLSYSSVFVPPFAATKERGGIATVSVDTAYQPQPRLSEVPGSPPIIKTFPDEKDAAAMVADVRKAKASGAVVIVSWHWGLSPATGGAGEMVPYQTEMAHAAIDAGADLVIGHHPHMLHPIEVYKGKTIFYSLGNFAFDLFYGRKQTTALARCVIRDGAIQEVAYIPALINETAQPALVDTEKGAGIVSHMETISQKFGAKFEVLEDRVLVR